MEPTVTRNLLRCWLLFGILLTATTGTSAAFAPAAACYRRRRRSSWSYYNDEQDEERRTRSSTRRWLVVASSEEEPPSRPFLTVVIPAYNEEERLPATLQRYQTYLAGKAESRWKDAGSQILVVDDGSTDQTAAVVRQFAAESTHCPVTCLSLPQNQGKGAALAAGMAEVVAAANHQSQPERGGLILTADADGSADPSCVEVMYETMLQQLLVTATSNNNKDDDVSASDLWNQPALVCGYRVYDDDNNNNTLLRRILHWGFGTTVRTLFWGTGGMGGIRDTQCGCKLLTLAAAPRLYSNLHLRRWSHDVEVLYRATRSSKTDDDDTTMLLAQAPVPWRDCAAGSRLAAEGVGRVALRMLWDIWVCRIAYAVGWWRMIVPRDDAPTRATT